MRLMFFFLLLTSNSFGQVDSLVRSKPWYACSLLEFNNIEKLSDTFNLYSSPDICICADKVSLLFKKDSIIDLKMEHGCKDFLSGVYYKNIFWSLDRKTNTISLWRKAGEKQDYQIVWLAKTKHFTLIATN